MKFEKQILVSLKIHFVGRYIDIIKIEKMKKKILSRRGKMSLRVVKAIGLENTFRNIYKKTKMFWLMYY